MYLDHDRGELAVITSRYAVRHRVTLEALVDRLLDRDPAAGERLADELERRAAHARERALEAEAHR